MKENSIEHKLLLFVAWKYGTKTFNKEEMLQEFEDSKWEFLSVKEIKKRYGKDININIGSE